MKVWLLALLLLSPAAFAGTLIPLQQPASVPISGQNTCVGDTFVAGDQSTGMCQVETPHCSGRSCSYTFTVYATQWDDTGAVVGTALCGSDLKYSGVDHWTYQPGYTAATCYLPKYSGHTYTLINGQWYGYITTSTDGAYELVVNGIHGELYQF